MNDNEYREGESGFAGQPEDNGPSGGENRTPPPYPYGQQPGSGPYPYGQNPGQTQYPYGQQPGRPQYPYGQQPGNTQYPYGQQPGNTQYPYGQQSGNTQYPYGQQPGNTQYPYGQQPGNTQYPYEQQPGNTEYPYGQQPGNTQYPYGQQPGRPQYPYGQQPGNIQYPYGQNRGGGPPYPYGGTGGYPYGYAARPPKKTLGQRVREAFADPARRELMLLGMAAGAAILLMLLFSNLFSVIITGSEDVYQRYLDDETFALLVETMYSIFCTALPFAMIFGIMHKLGLSRTEMSFGKPRGGWQTVLLLPAGLGVCFIGNLLSNYIITFAGSFGVTFRSYEYTLEQQTEAPETVGLMLLTVVHTAILPALLEELTFRGFLMQPLRKYGDWFAILTSALIFGLVHGNMTQAPFAILAGVALGYVNVVSGSMWTSILLHFLNNLISVLYTFAMTSAGESATIPLSLLVTYGTIAIGIAAFIGYIFSNRNFMRLRPGTAPRFEKKAAHYWLMPTMLFALLLLMREIALDIVIQ